MPKPPKASPDQTLTRLFVPDLVPEGVALRALFIGESPHRDEVAPENVDERSPFRGVAGREWWSELSRHLDAPLETRPKIAPRAELLRACRELRIGVMNAVRFPIDPKITLHQGPESAPRELLGFEKGSGPFGYKQVFKTLGDAGPAGRAIADLAGRLGELAGQPAQLVCLGNDSRWFVEQAISRLPPGCALTRQPLLTIPHPSSWWRNAAYKEKAVATVATLLSDRSAAARAG